MKEINRSEDTVVKFPYEQILDKINMRKQNHKKMTMEQRAGQFSPFAALVGYEDRVKETGRETNKKVILSEDEKELLDRKLEYIKEHLIRKKELVITHFIKDVSKEGGIYQKKHGIIKLVDNVNNSIELTDKSVIDIDDIKDINGFDIKY